MVPPFADHAALSTVANGYVQGRRLGVTIGGIEFFFTSPQSSKFGGTPGLVQI